jgi:hypothetical protein
MTAYHLKTRIHLTLRNVENGLSTPWHQNCGPGCHTRTRRKGEDGGRKYYEDKETGRKKMWQEILNEMTQEEQDNKEEEKMWENCHNGKYENARRLRRASR